MSTMYLITEVFGGTAIEDACDEAVRLANTLGVCVQFKFNDATCLARPGDEPGGLEKAWWRVAMDTETFPKPHFAVASDRENQEAAAARQRGGDLSSVAACEARGDTNEKNEA